nr:hypothetical protein [Hyalangium versicolor]
MPVWVNAHQVRIEGTMVEEAERQSIPYGGLAQFVTVWTDVSRVE